MLPRSSPMSDLIDKAHADAVLGLLHAALDPVPISVFDGKVPDPTPKVATNPWVLVYFNPGWPVDGKANSLDGTATTYQLTFFTHSIGATAAAARAVAGQVRAALLNVRPIVTGRSCWPIRWDDGSPTDRNEDLGFPVMDKVDVWKLQTAPG
jgi:hypothetical protein